LSRSRRCQTLIKLLRPVWSRPRADAGAEHLFSAGSTVRICSFGAKYDSVIINQERPRTLSTGRAAGRPHNTTLIGDSNRRRHRADVAVADRTRWGRTTTPRQIAGLLPVHFWATPMPTRSRGVPEAKRALVTEAIRGTHIRYILQRPTVRGFQVPDGIGRLGPNRSVGKRDLRQG